jgi:RNA polymerase sigma-70 factor (ECF subfamily)
MASVPGAVPSLVRLGVAGSASALGTESVKAHDGERALAQALVARRADAIEPAWRLLRPFVDRTLRRLLGPDRDQEDLLQEVFIRFFRTVPRLRDPDALRPFLFGIALRVVRREMRRRWLGRWSSRTPAAHDDGEQQHAESCAGDPLASEAVRRLLRVLSQVSAEDRSLFVARDVEEMELADVAAAHGLSFSTARRRLDRAWTRVRARAARDPILGGYLDARERRDADGVR